jgi:hypothetical protein
VGTPATACHCRRRSRFFGEELTREASANKRFFDKGLSLSLDQQDEDLLFTCSKQAVECEALSRALSITSLAQLSIGKKFLFIAGPKRSRATSLEMCISLRIPWVLHTFGESRGYLVK